MTRYVPAGIAPSAARTVCIDFDGTIIPWGPLDPSARGPYKGVADAVRSLREAGYRVVILTSRLSHAWHHAEALDRGVRCREFAFSQKSTVKAWLKHHDIEYDLLTAEKVPALVYIDDRAVRVDGIYTLVTAIGDFLHGHFEVKR